MHKGVDKGKQRAYSVYKQYIHYTHRKETSAITISINPASSEPLYAQIVRQIERQVLQGALQDGDQLPSIRALAKDLQVSIITTKRAYEELEREGILSVSAGRGTFIRAQGIAANRQAQMDELRHLLAKAAGQAKLLGVDGTTFSELAARLYKEDTSCNR